MNALWNAPISDRFSSLCASVFSPAAAILESEKTLGTRLTEERVAMITLFPSPYPTLVVTLGLMFDFKVFSF